MQAVTSQQIAYSNRVMLSFIRLYQLTVAPAFAVLFGQRCRFYPSCSHYAQLTFQKYTLPKATFLTSKRLVKCGPWHQGGVDLP
jgi:uncharacterized protein